ncbi:YrdB family protein [Natronomonas sp. EA1]|uniref:YrdB family protein n=1 Tax=Natronomonas sp. EA1 TaxID=3421655 RepID=UPI003EBC2B78
MSDDSLLRSPLGMGVYAVRFLLELAALAALAYWGLRTGTTLLVQVALAVIAPLFAAGVWGTFVAPTAPYRLPELPRLGLEILLFGVVALALASLGETTAAGAIAGLAVVDGLAVFYLETQTEN